MVAQAIVYRKFSGHSEKRKNFKRACKASIVEETRLGSGKAKAARVYRKSIREERELQR